MPVWGSTDRLHALGVFIFSLHQDFVSRGTHIDIKGLAVALDPPWPRS